MEAKRFPQKRTEPVKPAPKKSKIGKVIKGFFKVVLWIVLPLLLLVGIQHLLNGGIENIITSISNDGFLIFLKDFFVSIYTGFRALLRI